MPATPPPTACLALADGTLFYGRGFGATGTTTAELCFNTAMTGYQEIMTDPSYAGQIVTFTFPHIGNVGTNDEDDEGWATLSAVGKQVRNQASFDPQTYGYRKLSDLVKASGLFEVKQEGKTIWVRDKPRKRAAAKKAAG